MSIGHTDYHTKKVFEVFVRSISRFYTKYLNTSTSVSELWNTITNKNTQK